MTQVQKDKALEDVGGEGKGLQFNDEPEMVAERYWFGDPKDPRTSQGIFDLPRGVMLPDGRLVREVQMREMTGVEEDMLMGSGSFIKRLNVVLREVTDRIGDIGDKAKIGTLVKKMAVLDRSVMVIMLRRMTHGDLMPMSNVPCIHCGHKQSVNADLTTLDASVPKEPEKLDYETLLKKSGFTVPWRVFCGEGEEILSRVTDAVGQSGDVLTWTILVRAREINGVKIELSDRIFAGDGKLRMNNDLHKMIQAVKRLPAADRNQLRREFRDVEGDLNLEVAFECENTMCGQESHVKVNVASPDFLFPGEIR